MQGRETSDSTASKQSVLEASTGHRLAGINRRSEGPIPKVPSRYLHKLPHDLFACALLPECQELISLRCAARLPHIVVVAIQLMRRALPEVALPVSGAAEPACTAAAAATAEQERQHSAALTSKKGRLSIHMGCAIPLATACLKQPGRTQAAASVSVNGDSSIEAPSSSYLMYLKNLYLSHLQVTQSHAKHGVKAALQESRAQDAASLSGTDRLY